MRSDAWRRDAAALVLGLAYALSFSLPPTWAAGVQGLGLAGLFALLHPVERSLSARAAARCGFVFALSAFTAGLGWLFVSMHRYGGLAAPLAAIAVLLFAAYLGLFTSLACGLNARLRRPGSPTLVDVARFAGLSTLGELLRGMLFTGFPWLAVGYAQIDSPLAGLAPLTGVHGVTAAAWLAAGSFALIVIGLRRHRRFNSRALVALTATLLLAVAAAHLDWAEPGPDAFQARLVQGNVAQDMKFEPQRALEAMRRYIEAIDHTPTALTVLPETAWTVPWPRTPEPFVQALRERLERSGGVIAIGMPLLTARSGEAPSLPTNSMAVFDDQARVVARYDKRHLVPFGEFVPPGFRWFVNSMSIPLGDFGRGADHQPLLPIGEARVAFNICYEDLFGSELARQVRDGAHVLVNASNIAWFGDSHALGQHLAIARMRSLELARPMLRATNTGITAAIDHRGAVIAALPAHREATLLTEVKPIRGLTPYARHGDQPVWWLALGLTLVGLYGVRVNRTIHGTAEEPRRAD